jgi:hypothetical protein
MMPSKVASRPRAEGIEPQPNQQGQAPVAKKCNTGYQGSATAHQDMYPSDYHSRRHLSESALQSRTVTCQRSLLGMSTTYPSDVTDAGWTCVQRHLPFVSTQGRPRTHPLRRIIDAIFYVFRTGCAWRRCIQSAATLLGSGAQCRLVESELPLGQGL